MNLKSVIALAITAAFAAPVAAQMSPRTDTTGAPVHSGSNAPDRPANTPKADTGAPATTLPGAAGSTVRGGFAGLDRNGDGFISREEAKDASWNNRFSELDKDNDGRLSASEFSAMGAGAAGGTADKDAGSPSTTGGMGGSVGPAGTQSGSSTSGIGDKPGQKQ